MPFRTRSVLALPAAVLAACAPLPELHRAGNAPMTADYPALLPVDQLPLDAPAAAGTDPGPALNARAAALRARAVRLGAAGA